MHTLAPNTIALQPRSAQKSLARLGLAGFGQLLSPLTGGGNSPRATGFAADRPGPGSASEKSIGYSSRGAGGFWSADTIGRAEAIDFQWDWLEGLRARGIVALLVGEPVHAVQSLRLAWEHITREGVDEPGVFPVAPDLVEALVELGEVDQAHAVTSRLQVLAEQQGHPWGLATARRCSALRKWGAARRSLELAARTFDEIGSTGWADRARFEIDRIGARRPGRAGELTSTERRVVELAANGRSNKEIAQALFVAISTVEGHLSRAYGKLGVRSRAQLAHQVTRDGFPEVQPKS